MFPIDLDETSKTVITLLAGLVVPAMWRAVKAFFNNPTAQEAKWKEHKDYHEKHTEEHGRLDGKIKALFTYTDELRAEHVILHKKIAYLEGKVNGHKEVA